MTNKNQVGDKVWAYSYCFRRILKGEIKEFSTGGKWVGIVFDGFNDRQSLYRGDLYDTKAEAVEALRVWAEEGIKNLQTILDNLKYDTD